MFKNDSSQYFIIFFRVCLLKSILLTLIDLILGLGTAFTFMRNNVTNTAANMAKVILFFSLMLKGVLIGFKLMKGNFVVLNNYFDVD